MTYEMKNTVTDRIDARIHIIARKALSGEMNETKARWEILGALTEAAPWADVARSTPDIDAQLRADLTDSLGSLIESKVVEVTPGGFDLRQSLTTSPCGWARKMSRTAVPSRLRDIRNLTRKSVSVDPLISPTEADAVVRNNAAVSRAYHNHAEDTRSAYDELEDLHIDTLRETFSDAAAGTRRGRHLHLGARALIEGFRLPEPIRPTDFLDREHIRGEITANPELARMSVSAMFALTDNMETAEHAKIDKMLLAVWDNFSSEQLNALSQKPAAVADMLMLSAVSGQPKPSRDSIDQTVGLMVTASGNDVSRTASREFRPIAKQLVASWAAVECEARSDFNTKSAEASIEQDVQRMSDALAWPEISAEVAGLPGAPFGATSAAVGAWLTTAIRVYSGEAALAPAGLPVNA